MAAATPRETRAMVKFILDVGKAGLAPGPAKIQNPDCYFWKPEVLSDKTNRPEPNPVRGFPLSIFRRPPEMDEDTGEEKPSKLACWLLLSAPTLAVGRDKKIVELPAGRVVWADINQSVAGIARRAAPRKGEPMGLPVEVVEILIVPEYKRPIPPAAGQTKPRQAWVMKCYGGRGAPKADGFRTLDAATIAELADTIQIPDFGPADVSAFPMIGAPPEPIMALPTEAGPSNGAPAPAS